MDVNISKYVETQINSSGEMEVICAKHGLLMGSLGYVSRKTPVREYVDSVDKVLDCRMCLAEHVKQQRKENIRKNLIRRGTPLKKRMII